MDRKKMSNYRWVQWGVALVLVIGGLAFPANSTTWATSSAQFKLVNSSVSSQGVSNSNQFQLTSTSGEVTFGSRTTSTQFQHWPGFRLNSQSGTLQFNNATYTVKEGEGIVTITVTRTGGSDQAASVKYATSDGTAIAGVDYMAASGTLNWEAGDSTEKTFTVSVTDDQLYETSETVTLTLSEASVATLGSQSTATLTIADKGTVPTVSLIASSNTFVENSGETSVIATLNVAATQAVTIGLVYEGTAVRNTDFSANGTITIPAGATTGTVTLTAIPDEEAEANEIIDVDVISVSLGNGVGVRQTLTLIDDDVAGFKISKTNVKTDESGKSDSFTVALTSKPTNNVSFSVISSDITEGTVSPSLLNFSPDNWNLPQTVTVTGGDDAISDQNRTYTVVLESAFSLDIFYSGKDPADVTALNEDNDNIGIVVGQVQGNLKEGASSLETASFTVRLQSRPAANVSFDLRITDSNQQTDTTEASFSDGSAQSSQTLTFTRDNWLQDQTVTLYAQDDALNDNDQTINVVFENLITDDTNYSALNTQLASLTRTLINQDNDSAGIAVGTVAGNTSEDGKSSATVQVNLKTQPTAAVKIAVASTDVAEVTAAPAAFTFTADNWSAPQTVTFNGVDDSEQDGSQTVTVNFTGSGAAEYAGKTASVVVTNADDDVAALVISQISGNTREDGTPASFTVRLASQPNDKVSLTITSSNINEGETDRAQLAFTTSNWNSEQTIQVFGMDDSERDGNQPYTITLDPSASADSDYQALNPQDVNVVNEDNEVVGVLLSQMSDAVREDGTTGTFTAKLQLKPTANVTINFTSSDPNEGTVAPSSLIFTLENWGAAQTVTVTGMRGTEGITDGDQAFTIQSTIVSTDSDYAALKPAPVEGVNLDIDTAKVVQSDVSGQPTEDGDTAEFTLKLLSAPTGKVVITANSSNEAEGKVSPSTLTFTSDNWSAPQKIVVQGQDEAQGFDVIDGPQRFLANLAIDQTQTEDTAYSALTLDSVELFNQDNDSAAFIVSSMTGNLQENGLIPQFFTVKLSSRPADGATVTVALRPSDTTEGRLESSQLTFTSDDWSSEHKVNVFGVEDSEVDGDQSFFIQFDRAQSDDANYLLTPSNVTVVNEDNDQARFVLSALEGTVREDGSAATFKIRLGTLPAGDVVVALTTEQTDEVSLSKSTLTFTDKNWDADQTVMITGLADDISDGDQAFEIALTIDEAQTNDPNYATLTIESVTGTNEDIDVAGLVFSETNPNTSEEGGHSNFTLRLRSQPTGAVIVNLSVTKPEEAELKTTTVQFDETNWNANQTITVSGLNDNQQDKDQSYFVELTVDESSVDSLYRDLPIERVPFINEDNDVSGFLVTPLAQNTKEDGSKAEFKVRLSTLPDGDVMLSFQLEGSSTATPNINDEVQLSTASLTFTQENWKADQRVVVQGLDDSENDGDQSFFISFNAAESTADANYQGLKPDLLQGTNEDDDVADVVVEAIKGTVSEEGTQSSFQIRLRSRPAEGSTVTVGFQVAGEDTALPTLSVSTLTFTPDDWNSWKPVLITGQNDELIDGTQPFKVVFAEVVSTDPNYQGLVIPAIEGSTLDNDSADVLVSEVSGNTNEKGQRASFTVRLGGAPSSDITLTASLVSELDSSDNPITDAGLLEGKIVSGDEILVFTPNNWQAAQTIRVEGQDDDFQDDDQTFQVQFTVTSEDPNYSGWVVDPVTVLNEDDDNAGFIITELSQNAKEDGTAAEFQISLRSRPQDENQGGKTVTVQLTSSDISEGTVSPSSLVFTSGNWSSLHTVKVTGVDDTELDNDQTFRIDFSASVSEDPRYHGKIPDSVSVVNVDNDVSNFEVMPIAENVNEAGTQSLFQLRLLSQPSDEVNVEFSITGDDTALPMLSQSQLTFTTANWNSWQRITITGQNDEIQDGNQPYQVVFAKSTSNDTNYDGLQISALEGITEDNNVSGVLVSNPSGNTREDQQRAYFKLRLNSQPVGEVTVTASLVPEEDASGNPITDPSLLEGAIVNGDETLVFTPVNWNAEQRIRVVGQNDDFEDGDQPIRIQFAVTSTDPNYSGMSLDPVTVINEDDDVAGFIITELNRNVREDGTTGQFGVSLRSRPEDENQGGKTVTVNLTSTDVTEGTVEPSRIVFTSDDWSAVHRVRITGIDDTETDDDQTFRIDFSSAESEDLSYHGLSPDSVEVINIDDDVPEFIVSSVRGQTSEAGGQATFTVRLRSQPAVGETVTLPISSDTPTEATVSPTQLSFDSSNFSALQTVTVTGVNDEIPDGAQAYTIALGPATDTASGENTYDGVTPDNILLNNTDDDSVGFIVSDVSGAVSEEGLEKFITVRLQTQPNDTVTIPVSSSNTNEGVVQTPQLIFNATNWNADQTIGVVGVDDTIADGNQVFQVLLGTVTSGDANYNGLVVGEVDVTNLDNDYSGIVVGELSNDVNEGGKTGEFFVRLRSNPGADVTLRLTTSNPDEVQFLLDNSTTSTELLRYNTNNWRGRQMVTVVGVNDAISDSNQLSTIRIEVDDDLSSAYQDVIGEEVDVINEDNDVAGIFVSAVDGKTKEDGSATSFTIRLESEPQADVIIGLSSSNLSEGTVVPASLTFTADNWDALQTVRVIGADDELDDGDQSFLIEFAESASTDSNYQGLKLASLAVINEDDETPGFLLTEPSNNTREDGTQAEFCVRLSSPPATGSSVTFSLQSSLETEGKTYPPSLTFTDANWQSCQIVTVIGQNDNEIPEAKPPVGFFGRLANTMNRWLGIEAERAATTSAQDGDQAYHVIFSAAASDDPNYEGSTPSRVLLVNEDDDTAGFIFSSVEGTITETGSQGTFTIKLRTIPSGDVTVGLAVSDETEGSVSPAQVVFTPENFNAARTITVTGKDDLITDGDRSFHVQFSIIDTANANNEYIGLETQSVLVTNTDNETAGLVISEIQGQPREDGETGTFTVSLKAQPIASVTVALSSSNSEEILFLSGATTSNTQTLNFDSTNWDSPQTVTLQGVDESGVPIADGNQLVRINISTAASADTEYAAIYVPFLEVNNEDNDSPGFLLTEPVGSLTEGIEGTSSFTVQLKTAPNGTVTIPLGLDRTNEISLSETSLVFDANNYDQPQTVTIHSLDESIADKDQVITILAGPTESGDSVYHGYLAGTLTVVNQDNDSPGISVGSVQGNTKEDGSGSATFTLTLDSEPTAEVTFNLSSLDTSEGVVATPTLAFNATNWNVPQTVTVNGVDDFVSDGNQIFQVTATLRSSDGNYDDFPFEPVSMVNEDNDQASFNLNPTSVSINENASTASFSLGLGLSPIVDVTLQLATDSTEAALSKTTLTFTPADWDTPQNVVVTGVDDNLIDGTVSSTLQITVVSEDEAYSSLTPPTLTIQTEDNDVAGLIASTELVSVDEGGSTNSFTLQLRTIPTADVTVNLSSDATEASLSPTSLTFTTADWNLPQTIGVTGVDDDIIDGSVTSLIQISLSSADTHYAEVVPPTITVQTADNDSGGFVLSDVSDLSVTEASTRTDSFTVQLSAQPIANVTLQFNSADTSEVTVTESRTFTSTNWNVAQTVTVTAVDDVVDDGNQVTLISATIVSDDTAYSGLTFPSISVVTVDDDQQVDASDGGTVTNSDTFTSSNLNLAINWDNGVNVGSQVTSGGDIIREYIPAGGANSGISKTTTIMHKAPVNGRQPGLEGVVEPQLVEGQKSTVYLEGNASGFVSDAASFVGTKTVDAATIQASINFDGGIEIAVTASETSQTVLLPEMALGANAVISETSVEVEMTLPDNSEGAPRLVGAIDSTRWYYMGRDLETKEVVYLRGLKGGKIKIIRQLSGNTTLIRVEAGSVELRIGQASLVEKQTGEEIQVINQAYEFPIQAGSNLISAGVGSLLSPAELEVKMRHVHSVWRWNYVAPDWQVYSPQTTVNQKLTEALQVSPMTTDIQLDEGLWIYAEAASTFWMHDKDYVELKPDLSLGGWYLLGNNTGKLIPIGEFFDQNGEIQSLWLVREDRWKAYATDSQIDALIVEEPDVDQLSSEDVIPPGQAFWVNTETGITITRENLRLPPGGIKSE